MAKFTAEQLALLNDRDFLILPIPTKIEEGKGIYSSGGPNGCYIQYRGIKSERERLQRAAEHLGISYSAFMRCLINDAVEEILKRYESGADD